MRTLYLLCSLALALPRDQAVELAGAKANLKIASEAMTEWGRHHTAWFQARHNGSDAPPPGPPLNPAQWAYLDGQLARLERLSQGDDKDLKEIRALVTEARAALASGRDALLKPGQDPTRASEALNAVHQAVSNALDMVDDVVKAAGVPDNPPNDKNVTAANGHHPGGGDQIAAAPGGGGVAGAGEAPKTAASGQPSPDQVKSLALNGNVLKKINGSAFGPEKADGLAGPKDAKAAKDLKGVTGSGIKPLDDLARALPGMRQTGRYQHALQESGLKSLDVATGPDGRQVFVSGVERKYVPDEVVQKFRDELARTPANADLGGYGRCRGCLTPEEYKRVAEAAREGRHPAVQQLDVFADATKWESTCSKVEVDGGGCNPVAAELGLSYKGGELVPPSVLKQIADRLEKEPEAIVASALPVTLSGAAKRPPANVDPRTGAPRAGSQAGQPAPHPVTLPVSVLPSLSAACDLMPLGLNRGCRRALLRSALEAEAGGDERVARTLALRAGLAEPGREIPAAGLAMGLPEGSVVTPLRGGLYEVRALGLKELRAADGSLLRSEEGGVIREFAAGRLTRLVEGNLTLTGDFDPDTGRLVTGSISRVKDDGSVEAVTTAFEAEGGALRRVYRDASGNVLPTDQPLVTKLPGENAWRLSLAADPGAAALALVRHLQQPEEGESLDLEKVAAYTDLLRGITGPADALVAPNGDLIIRQRGVQTLVRDEPLKTPWFKEGKPDSQAFYAANKEKVDAVMRKKYGASLDMIAVQDYGRYREALELLDALVRQDEMRNGRLAVRGLMVYQRFSPEGKFVPIQQHVGGLGVDFFRPKVETTSHVNPIRWFTGPETWTENVVVRQKYGENRKLEPHELITLKEKTLFEGAGLVGEMGGVVGRVGHNTTNVIAAASSWVLGTAAVAGDKDVAAFHYEQARANIGDIKALWRESPEEEAVRRRLTAAGIGGWRRELEVHNVDKLVDGPVGAVLKGGVTAADDLPMTLAGAKGFHMVAQAGKWGRAAAVGFNMYDTFDDSYQLTRNLNDLGYAVAHYEGRADDKARLNAALEKTVSMTVGLIGTAETARDGVQMSKLRAKSKKLEHLLIDEMDAGAVHVQKAAPLDTVFDRTSLDRVTMDWINAVRPDRLKAAGLLEALDARTLKEYSDRGDAEGLRRHLTSSLMYVRAANATVTEQLVPKTLSYELEKALVQLAGVPDTGEALRFNSVVEQIGRHAKSGEFAAAEKLIDAERAGLLGVSYGYRYKLLGRLEETRLDLISAMTRSREHKARATSLEAAAQLGYAKTVKPLVDLGPGNQRRELSCGLRALHEMAVQLRNSGVDVPPELLTYQNVSDAVKKYAASVHGYTSVGVQYGTPDAVSNGVLFQEWGLKPAVNNHNGSYRIKGSPESGLAAVVSAKGSVIYSVMDFGSSSHAIALGGMLDAGGKTYYQVLNSWGQRTYVTYDELGFIYGQRGFVQAAAPAADTGAKLTAFLKKYGSFQPKKQP